MFSIFVRFVTLFLAISMVWSIIDPDTGKDMEAIVQSKGYPIEKHSVTTEDGYILGVFRIPGGRNTTNSDKQGVRPPVFLLHGLLDSSWAWVANFPEESLGFILADHGYDVWFGNSRGNFYSTAHTTYPVNSPQFWDFTYDDMAQYDIPAQLKYVLQVTGQKQLSYVGHSQGTIEALIAFSENETVASYVNFAALLAPVAYVHHAGGLTTLLADLDLDVLFALFGVEDFLPDATFLQKYFPGVCEWVEWGCEDFLFLVVGGSLNLNKTRIEVYISQTPAGTSVKNMGHWAQGIRAEEFQKFDYGSAAANFQHYGQTTPPQYHLANYKVPSAFYFGGNDVLADPTDVATLLGEIPTSSIVQSLYQPSFAHLDYTWGYNILAEDVYGDVLKQLAKFNTPTK